MGVMDDVPTPDEAFDFSLTDTIEMPDTKTRKDCSQCDKIMAVIGCLLGGFIIAMGIDLLTKGSLSRAVDSMFTREGVDEE